jgi:hypothetical protein
MKKLIQKTVSLTLIGINGNAFAIMGAFIKQAKRENWTQDEIDTVINEAQSSDYNHLLTTIDNHCETIEE